MATEKCFFFRVDQCGLAMMRGEMTYAAKPVTLSSDFRKMTQYGAGVGRAMISYRSHLSSTISVSKPKFKFISNGRKTLLAAIISFNNDKFVFCNQLSLLQFELLPIAAF